MEGFAVDEVKDLRQSEEYGRYMEKIGWETIKIQCSKSKVQVFIKSLGILGAIAKIQRVSLPLPWEEINKVLKKYRVRMVKIEPNSQFSIFNFQCGSSLERVAILNSQRFKRDGWPLLGTKTLRVDLRSSQEKILTSFKKDARSSIRKLEAGSWKLERNNFEHFYEMWKRAARVKKLWIPPKRNYEALIECFGEKCFCVTINNLAGGLVLMHDKTAYYYYAGSLPEGKRLQLPYSSVWELMKEAKKRGCEWWDFEGIYDGRWPNKGWMGFTHFKKSFGGEEVEYPGSFTRWF